MYLGQIIFILFCEFLMALPIFWEKAWILSGVRRMYSRKPIWGIDLIRMLLSQVAAWRDGTTTRTAWLLPESCHWEQLPRSSTSFVVVGHTIMFLWRLLFLSLLDLMHWQKVLGLQINYVTTLPLLYSFEDELLWRDSISGRFIDTDISCTIWN